jgi:hypothetical protein
VNPKPDELTGEFLARFSDAHAAMKHFVSDLETAPAGQMPWAAWAKLLALRLGDLLDVLNDVRDADEAKAAAG